MTPEQAIKIIARHAVANQPRFIEDMWENYPEIGEEDWEAVVFEAEGMSLFPTDAEWDEAYALLSSRAGEA